VSVITQRSLVQIRDSQLYYAGPGPTEQHFHSQDNHRVLINRCPKESPVPAASLVLGPSARVRRTSHLLRTFGGDRLRFKLEGCKPSVLWAWQWEMPITRPSLPCGILELSVANTYPPGHATSRSP
jgi:hypothetical protein